LHQWISPQLSHSASEILDQFFVCKEATLLLPSS
jgi:hypothetical protein